MADETGRRLVPRMRRLMSFTAIGKGGDQAASGFSRPDFTGVWKQVQHENANAYFAAMGYSFALRSIVVRFIGDSTEVVSHKGEMVHLNSINRRGEWKRTYVDNQEIPLTMADGQAVTSTSWWERDETLGVDVHKTRLVGAKEGTLETWRWMDPADSDSGQGQGRMVVKSIVYPQGGEAEPAHMLWHFEPAREEKQKIQSHLLLRSFEDLYVKPSTRSGAETLPRPGEDRGADPQHPSAASPVARESAPHLAASPVSSWLERFSKNLSESFATTDRLAMDHSFLN